MRLSNPLKREFSIVVIEAGQGEALVVAAGPWDDTDLRGERIQRNKGGFQRFETIVWELL